MELYRVVISDATNVASWEVASSMLAVGLSWRHATSSIAVGHVIVAVRFNHPLYPLESTGWKVVVVLTGTIGARLRVPFPVLSRSSSGSG